MPHHEEALGIFERLGDGAGVAETVDLIAMAHHVAGEQRAASAYYERSVALFTELDDRRGLANALAPAGAVRPVVPLVIDDAIHQRRGIRGASVAPVAAIGSRDRLACRRGVSTIPDRRLSGVARRVRTRNSTAHEALAEAEEIDHLEWTAGAFRLLGVLSLELLSPDAAREHLEAAHQIAQRLGSHIWIRWTAAPLAVARARTSDLSGALDVLERAARLSAGADAGDAPAGADSRTLTLGERQLWLARAELALAEHRPELALEIVDARLASERAANPDDVLGVPRLSLLRAEALSALGRYEDAERTLESARARGCGTERTADAVEGRSGARARVPVAATPPRGTSRI